MTNQQNDNNWWKCVKAVSWYWIIIGLLMIGIFLIDLISGNISNPNRYVAVIMQVFQVVVGVSILARKYWARFAGFVYGAFITLKFPLGTVLGFMNESGVFYYTWIKLGYFSLSEGTLREK